ncbi:hypothetical protein HOU02_gp151 [Caulobacter phage CcrBL9]|uniref:Uncharacterized protein n=1 Tax=Caulobacter phage CcrBL9 TaxID=2283270 RepID=A0A385EE79_9CAUD|nr:hypothetical protein HOU02_gp034 [Caulobacter phage CcrBL9]YP_009810204.1 hypothetical protein HOU02_gp151 [Caulobacter phage CcrBL9]AXQ69058.1 hypothetical protein CcrBL9_gp034 [Caulobacter phage CcrBL9]AXQ69574.1 hypothetical protein CcrBL9_gp550 [Caulobacter phage CcrBL9]
MTRRPAYLTVLGGIGLILASLALSAASAPEKRVLVGQYCDGDLVRLYGLEDGEEAAEACAIVEVHALPKGL